MVPEPFAWKGMCWAERDGTRQRNSKTWTECVNLVHMRLAWSDLYMWIALKYCPVEMLMVEAVNYSECIPKLICSILSPFCGIQ